MARATFCLIALVLSVGCSEDETAGGGAPSDAGSDASTATLGVVSVAELAASLPTKDYQLIDVHTPYAGEIAGTDAVISYQDVPAIEAFVGPDLDAKVVAYCMSSSMSSIAGKALVADGYRNVRYLEGGMSAWTSAGHSLEYHDQ